MDWGHIHHKVFHEAWVPFHFFINIFLSTEIGLAAFILIVITVAVPAAITLGVAFTSIAPITICWLLRGSLLVGSLAFQHSQLRVAQCSLLRSSSCRANFAKLLDGLVDVSFKHNSTLKSSCATFRTVTKPRDNPPLPAERSTGS
jgi:hypothetical protein